VVRSRPTNQRLSISRTLQSIAGHPVEFPVKTRTSRRCIDLDDATMDVLARWRRHLRREGLAHGADDWMFLNTAGRFINPESLSQLFDRLQRTMPDLTRIRFHDLRHTHASLLIMDGVPVKVVSERLGHANVAFTIHTYQHLLPGMSAAAAHSSPPSSPPTPGRRLPARSERSPRSARRTRPSR
jgi:integrase